MRLHFWSRLPHSMDRWPVYALTLTDREITFWKYSNPPKFPLICRYVSNDLAT